MTFEEIIILFIKNSGFRQKYVPIHFNWEILSLRGFGAFIENHGNISLILNGNFFLSAISELLLE